MHPIRPILLAGAILFLPAIAEAQRIVVHTSQSQRRATREIVPQRELALGVGVLRYGETQDYAPMAALRADWRLARWVRSELGVSYALAELPGPAGSDVNGHLTTATVGLRAEVPWPAIRPYVGIAAGLFGRFQESGDDEVDPTFDGDSFVRPTIAVPVGVRIPLSLRLGLRGEVRWRFDEHPTGASVVSREHTAGLSFAF